MHSVLKKRLTSILLFFLVTCINTGLVALFLFIFKAEGSNLILLIWISVTSLLFFLIRSDIQIPSVLKYILWSISGLFIASGCGLLLIQLGAADRSFAEIWFDMTRNGDSFGFFSFFAAEIYSLFLLIPLWLAAGKKYFLSILSLFAVNALCYGIITGFQILLILSALLCFITLFIVIDFRKFLFPVVITLILTVTVSIAGLKTNNSISNLLYLDISYFVAKVAPDFPLLLNIPGYGFSVKAQKPTQNVYLSNRNLFTVQGLPNQLVFFNTERYVMWNGYSWQKERVKKEIDNVKLINKESIEEKSLKYGDYSSRLVLSLEEDFYSSIPCTSATSVLIVPPNIDVKDLEPNTINGAFFPAGIKRGIYAELLESSDKIDTDSEVENEIQQYSLITKRMLSLSDELLEKAKKAIPDEREFHKEDLINSENIDTKSNWSHGADKVSIPDGLLRREYIKTVLNYLKEGFTYSLQTPPLPEGQDVLEWFALDSKIGFCSWFSGAFTILMQAQGIPCRIQEGFRVQLGEQGQGRINGMCSHSRPEVFVDGQWRAFEPTPPYASEKPFDYVDNKDARTIKQLSSVFTIPGIVEEKTNNESFFYKVFSFLSYKSLKNYFHLLQKNFGILIVITVIFLVFLFAFNIKISEKRKMKRLINSGRKIVQKMSKYGVESPSKIGWIEWKISVNNLFNSGKIKAKTRLQADEISNSIIKVIYITKSE